MMIEERVLGYIYHIETRKPISKGFPLGILIYYAWPQPLRPFSNNLFKLIVRVSKT